MEPHQPASLVKKSKLKQLQPLLFLFIFGSLFFLANAFFSIKDIECYSQKKPCSTQTTEKLSTLKNRSLFFSNFDQLSQEYKNVTIKKKLPSTLIIDLEEEKQEYFSLFGSEIQKTQYETHDPKISLIANKISNELEKAQIMWTKIEYINQVLIVYFENRGSFYRALIDSHEIDTGVYRLKTTIDHIDIKEQVDVAIKEIDTRFKLPVLKTEFTNI